MLSPAERVAQDLIDAFGPELAHEKVDAFLAQWSVVELAGHEADWEDFWARPKQLPPDGDWLSWGFLGGRGLGKTLGVSKFVNREIQEGRAILIGLAAQDEENCVKVQVTGPSGLIATAPFGFKPEWHSTDLELRWPNGARAYVRTPEVPGKIRGLDYHLFWATEIQSWPPSTRDEALSNAIISTRLGLARFLWDATPKKRHPLLRKLLAKAERSPARHVVVRGTTYENPYLGAAYIGNLEDDMGGTQKGREELLGEMLEDSDSALVKQAWIDKSRRPMPERIERRVISVDPAVTNRKGSDNTGIIDFGIGVDGQGLVLGDDSGKHDVGRWADIVLERHATGGADYVLAETNKGGQLVVQNLRAAAKEKKLNVVVVGKDEQPRHTPGVVYVKEVYARGAKEDRAEPVATAYERGRISHVFGVNLTSLEDTLTTWEPAPNADSPGDLDALTHAAVELLRMNSNVAEGSTGFIGIAQAARELYAPAAASTPRPGAATPMSIFDAMRGASRI